MYERVLYKMRDKVRSRQYVMALHAEEEMEDDGLSIFDVESCVLTGEIIERQKDAQTGEWKYVVKGRVIRKRDRNRWKIWCYQQTGANHCLQRLKNMETTMICDNCGKEGAHIRYVSRSYGKGANLLVIENIPVVTCPHCGESYLTADTLHEIERIKLHRNHFAVERSVPVATYMLTNGG